MDSHTHAHGAVEKQRITILSPISLGMSWRYVAAVTAVLLLLVSSVGAFGTLWLYQSEKRVSDARELKTRLEQLVTMAVDAETGQRGFVITGEASYLKPYLESTVKMDAQFAAVGSLLGDDDAQRLRLIRLANLLAKKRTELSAVIDARRTKGAVEAVKMVSSGEGMSLMDDARAVVQEMEEAANQRIDARSLRAEKVRNLAIVAGILTFLLTTIGLAVVFRATGRMLRDRINAAREVAEQSALLQAVVMNVADALIVVDDRARVQMLNPAAEALCGTTDCDARGRRIDSVLPLITREGDSLTSPAYSAMVRKARVDETAMLVTAAGDLCIKQTATPIADDAGNSAGAVVIARDVTLAVESERRLTESDRRKTEFISILSHELRNPLAAVRSAVQALSKPLSANRHANLIGMADRQMSNMVRLVDDLLDVGRLERGTLRPRITTGTLRAVVNEAMEAVQAQTTARRNVVELRGLEHDILLACDKPRLVQVFANLISNASRYSPEGSSIAIEAKAAANKRVLIKVKGRRRWYREARSRTYL